MHIELSFTSQQTAIFLNTAAQDPTLLETQTLIEEVNILEVLGVVGPEGESRSEEEGEKGELDHYPKLI